MTDRTLVIDDATGAIRRTLAMPPEMLALNVEAGESLFVVAGDDGLCIDDAHLVVGTTGALEPAPGAPSGTTAPAYELQYVAA